MEMQFISSCTLYEATKEVIKEIDHKNLSEKNLVVVPDSFSMQAESLIFDVLQIKTTFNIAVVGISRLAGKLLREHNEEFERISGLDEIVYTYEAIKKCEGEFLYFKNNGMDLALQILEILKQFFNCELAPEDIKDCNDENLSKKMHDLRLVYAEYIRLLENKLDLVKLLDFFLEKDFDLSNYNLYFVNFDSFSTKIFSFICALAKKVKKIVIGVAKPLGYGNAYIYETDTTKKMLSLATEKGILVKVKERESNLSEEKLAVLKNAFSLQPEKFKEGYFINLVPTSADDELEFVAKYISFTIHSGARFKDFAIAVPEEGYFKKIAKLFSKYDIPVYADYTLSLGDVAVSKFFLKMLSLQSGVGKEDIEYLLFSPLTGIENADELLKIVDYYQTDGMGEFKLHSNALDDIFSLLSSFKKEGEISEFVQVSLEILELIKNNIANLNIFDLQKQSENEQAIVYIEKILKEIAGKKIALKMSDYQTLISTIFASIKVETVPSYIDAVFVGDATKSYFQDVPYLFVLGATASALPRTEKDNGILTDEDLSKLNYLKQIEPEIRVINRRNRLKLYEVLAHADKALFISTPLGKEGRKAGFVEDLIKVFGDKCVLHTASMQNFNRPDLDEAGKDKLMFFHLANRRVANENLQKLMPSLDERRINSALDVVGKDIFAYNYEKIAFSPLSDKISASQLECYFGCPFRHFVSYTLKIKEKEFARIDKRKIGIFKHDLAKLFVEEKNFKIKSVSEREVEEFLRRKFKALSEKHFDKYSLSNRALMRNIYKEGKVLLLNLVYEQKQSDFEILSVEEKVESKIGEKKFVGYIDRVDRYKNYFRIIDYKTGTVDGLLKDLFYGRKLQLFLYGKVAGEKLKKECAGLYYFDCKNKFKKKDDKTKILNGITLKDNEVVYATDFRLQDLNFRSDLIGAEKKAKSDGFDFKYGNFASDLDRYFDYAVVVSEKAIEEIEDGYIEPKPLDKECDFCPYHAVCKFSENKARKKGRGFSGD